MAALWAMMTMKHENEMWQDTIIRTEKERHATAVLLTETQRQLAEARQEIERLKDALTPLREYDE